MGLEIAIATGIATPIHRQIADQIRRAMATGRLLPGEQMPSVRVLAEELLLNPNTIARVYADLIRDRGVLEKGQKGKGVYVAPLERQRGIYSRASERLRRLNALSLQTFINDGVCLGFTPDQLRAAFERQIRDLATPAEKGGIQP